jgi:uncharacterized HAD superfamily protein
MEGKYMGRRLNIGVDVDGVLSDFATSARKLCKQMFNGTPADSLIQTSWSFDSLGITREQESRMWRKIDAIPNWWLNHDKLPNTELLPELCAKHRVIFITNRKDGTGWPIEDQTKIWLKRNFGVVNTNVILSDAKGPVAVGLKLDYFIDDRPKNVLEVIAEAPATRVFLQDGSYNQECKGVDRVVSFNEFVEVIRRVE